MDRILLVVVVIASLLAIAPRLDLFRAAPPANPITTGALPAAPSPQAGAPASPPNVPPVSEAAVRRDDPQTVPPVATAPQHVTAPSQMPTPPATPAPPTETAAAAPVPSASPLPHPPAPQPAAAPVAAGPVPPAPVPALPPPVASAPPLPATAPHVAVPDADRVLLLVRTALLSLNDAMRTGNYTVLRDIGGPYFKEFNSAARLSQIFSPLAAQNLDLSMVAVMTPVYSEPPHLDVRNTLRIRGHFPGRPVQLNFDILYEPVAGHWRLYGLTVVAAPAGGEPLVNRPSGSKEPVSKTAGR